MLDRLIILFFAHVFIVFKLLFRLFCINGATLKSRCRMPCLIRLQEFILIIFFVLMLTVLLAGRKSIYKY